MEADELRRLRLTPPDRFVAARNQLVKQLKAAGDKQSAAAVAALRRGSWTDWALNSVADDEPRLAARYLDAAESVRQLQGSGAGDLRAALRELRDVSNEIVRAASARMTGAGHTPDLLELVERLAEVGNHPAASERMREATLAADVGPVADRGDASDESDESDEGDEPFTPAPTTRRRRAEKSAGDRRAASGAAPAQQRSADVQRRTRLQRAVDEAQHAVDEATRELEQAERNLASADAAVDTATEAVERANVELSDARRRLIDAKKRRQSAHHDVVASTKMLERARDELDRSSGR